MKKSESSTSLSFNTTWYWRIVDFFKIYIFKGELQQQTESRLPELLRMEEKLSEINTELLMFYFLIRSL